jgi:hypothetical protein
MPSLHTIGFRFHHAPSVELLRVISTAAPNVTRIIQMVGNTSVNHPDWIASLLSFRRLQQLSLQLSYDLLCSASQTLSVNWLPVAHCLTELEIYDIETRVAYRPWPSFMVLLLSWAAFFSLQP